jgi:hypothetical protein
MEEQKYSRPGSEFDGKTLKEILEMLESRELFPDQVERAKQLIERAGGGEKLRLAMFGDKADRNP